MMPRMNSITGKAAKANSTAVAPRLFLKNFIYRIRIMVVDETVTDCGHEYTTSGKIGVNG